MSEEQPTRTHTHWKEPMPEDDNRSPDRKEFAKLISAARRQVQVNRTESIDLGRPKIFEVELLGEVCFSLYLTVRSLTRQVEDLQKAATAPSTAAQRR
jgi:hypothetical protein